jgi:hypothetical protein
VLLAEMLVAGEGGPDDHIGALLLLKLISGASHFARHRRSQPPLPHAAL